MKKNAWLSMAGSFVAYMLIGVAIIAAYPSNLTPQHDSNYIALASAYFIVAGLLLAAHVAKGLDLFEPIVFVTFLYLMIFSITPLLDVLTDNIAILGVNTMDGCLKATAIFVLSYLAFFIGYFILRPTDRAGGEAVAPSHSGQQRTILLTGLTLWTICYVVSSVPVLLSGRSWLFILTGGLAGSVALDAATEMSLDFVNLFAYCLIPSFMYVLAYGKNNFFKLVLLALTFSAFLIRGYRFIMIVTLFAPLIYLYLKQDKRPSAMAIALLSGVTALLVGVVGFMRDSIRIGDTINWNNFNFALVVESVKGNFEIYKPFYGLVNTIPDLHDYTWGEQIAYTFTLLIPRAVWPGKPAPILYDLIGQSVSDGAVTAGLAWPNLGEFYSEFGLAGCLFFMFIFGSLCGWSIRLYRSPSVSRHDLIAYSIILPATLQLVIRGYTPSNFYLMVFLLLPVLLIKWLTAARNGVAMHEQHS